jgi:hypothetical protein
MQQNWFMQASVLLVVAASGCSRKQAAPPVPATVPAPPVPKSTASKPVPAAVPPPAKPSETVKPPSLGEILPSPSREQLLKDIEASLDRARRNIATLQSRTTTAADRNRDVARVQTFIRQAQDARSNNDLVVARSLAERADLLSQDLIRAP